MTRNEVREKLLEKGVDTRDFFWSLSEQPLLKDINARVLPCPVSERVAREGFYLPSGLALSDVEIRQVCDIIREILWTTS